MNVQDLSRLLPKRSADAHKGRHGHVLLIGGNHGTPGAILMAGRAALRSGAGLVTVATRAEHAVALSMAQPELMSHGVERKTQLAPLIERANVIAIGPGLGQDEWAQAMLGAVLQSRQPQVWDADALNLLAQEPVRSERWVLTPHPGEAGRLLGCSTAEVQRDRLQAAQQLQARYGGVAVLKGTGTVVQGSATQICPYGNPGMAVGGMGDVLAGVIAALIAQGLSLESAAHAGVLAHALAGDAAAQLGGERGLLPEDLIAQLRRVLNP